MTYTQYFKRSTRDNGQEFSHLVDNAPEDLRTFIRHVHTEHFYDCFLNDWIYATIHEAFSEIEAHGLEQCNIEPDIHNNKLYKWLYDNGNAFASIFCDEYVEEYTLGSKDITKMISGGQWLAMSRIYHAVNDFIQKHKEAL
jgi:hypothetical protein